MKIMLSTKSSNEIFLFSKSRRSKSDSQDKSLSYVWLKSFLETLDGLGLYYYTTAVTQTISPSTMRSKNWQHQSGLPCTESCFIVSQCWMLSIYIVYIDQLKDRLYKFSKRKYKFYPFSYIYSVVANSCYYYNHWFVQDL